MDTSSKIPQYNTNNVYQDDLHLTFSDVYRGYRKATPGCNGLIEVAWSIGWVSQLVGRLVGRFVRPLVHRSSFSFAQFMM